MTQVDARTFLCEHCNTGFVAPPGRRVAEFHHICRNVQGHNVWEYAVKLEEQPKEALREAHAEESEAQVKEASRTWREARRLPEAG